MPFCHVCFKEARKDEKFCPADRNWLYVRLCPHCFKEVLESENYCIKCGKDISSDKIEQKCEFRWVGAGYRLLAGVIDFLCCFYVGVVFLQIQYFQAHPLPAAGIYLFFILFYFSFFNSHNRQTIGKQVLGIVSVRSDLKKILYLRSLIKMVLVGVTLGFGYLALVDVRTKQTWYDRAVDCVVVELPG